MLSARSSSKTRTTSQGKILCAKIISKVLFLYLTNVLALPSARLTLSSDLASYTLLVALLSSVHKIFFCHDVIATISWGTMHADVVNLVHPTGFDCI